MDDWKSNRQLLAEGFTPYPALLETEKPSIPDMGFILIGEEKIDVRGIQNVICQERRTALGSRMRRVNYAMNTK